MGIQTIAVGDEGLVVAYFKDAVFRAYHKARIFNGNADCLFHCTVAGVGRLINP